MAKLPQDIVADILSRLPVKSLLRFKCVSKPWFSLISDSQFAKTQLKQAKSDCNGNIRRVLLTTSPLQSIDYEAFGFGDGSDSNITVQLGYPGEKVPEDDADIIGSCNGLVCIDFDSTNMVLWNPSTRVSRELPRPAPFPEQGTFFDGLGYDTSGDDYKVIRGFISTIGNGNVSRETKVQVFSLKNNSWKEIQYFHARIDIYGLGVLSNGKLHWLGILENGSNKNYAIVSFDLTEERFTEVASLPEHIDQTTSVVNLRNWGDRIVVFNDQRDGSFEAWEMKESSWTRLFSISRDKFPEYEYYPTLIGFTKDGKFLLGSDGRELVFYSTKEDTFRYFEIYDEWRWFEGVIYEESLVSPIVDEASKFK
ncbi:hypothetical protein AB3S75_045029 [Citrus x aurantiifolia]